MKISVIAHPNSKKPRIEKDVLNTFHVYVTERPFNGKANEAVVESLADFFRIKKNQIMLLSGEKAKHKIFEILISSPNVSKK